MLEKSGYSRIFIDSKGGQLTLFILLSIVLVAVIIISFFFLQPDFYARQFGNVNFESCVNDVTDDVISELALTGGERTPQFYYEYQSQRIPYFCYTNEPYVTCTVQKPLIKQAFESELLLHLEPRVNECYSNSVDELKDRGFEVKEGNIRLNVTIIPDRVTIDIEAPTTVEGQRFTNYRTAINSNIYDVLLIATSVVQYESSYGDTPTAEIMFYYPDIIIDKVRRGDGTKVYIITDKGSETKFQFASRSLVWPAGYDNR